MTKLHNAFADQWDDPYPPLEGWRSHVKRLVPPGHDLGMSLYELLPGQTQCPYHFHHGDEELVLVLGGRPTLRTADGEQELQPGDFAHFPKGPDGAHQMINRSDEPARYVVASSNVAPEICEYPDSGKVAVFSRLESQRGERLVTVHRLDDGVDYFEGEAPRAS
jgi:uncharacterized cupin superfamily protein